MARIMLEKKISSKILMVGVFIGKNAPGGMASVVLSYKPFFEKFRYITSWKDSNKLVKGLFSLSAFVKLFFNLLCHPEIKIVHFHTAEKNSFWRKTALMEIAYFFNKKVIMHMHGATFKDFYSNASEVVQKRILLKIQKMHKIIVLSNSWQEWFISIGISPQKIAIINNIICHPRVHPTNSNSTKIHLLFLGEIGDRKGIFDILKTIYENHVYFSQRIVFKIGGNKNEDKLKERIKEYHLEDFVCFEGWVSGEKKEELLSWADIYILPSFNEGLPIGILEAMSYNCAIIASSVGGIPDIITHNKNGMLVAPGNTCEIYQALKLLIDDRDRLRSFQMMNNHLITSYYPECVIKQLQTLYLQLLSD